MSGYGLFSQYYDSLTQNVEYGRRCEYLMQLLERYQAKPGLLLDLACGTGSLSLEFARRGAEVIGADASEEMLSVAQQKAAQAEQSILFLCQKMQELDLYGTVDTVVCTLDSINHLLSAADVRETFRRVSLFLNPGGFFLFDVNTGYKHEQVLANQTFIYDTEPVFCVWQNEYVPEKTLTNIQLDFFEKQGHGLYRRRTERFAERVYAPEQLRQWLAGSGLQLLGEFGEWTFQPPHEKTERIVYAAQKLG